MKDKRIQRKGCVEEVLQKYICLNLYLLLYHGLIYILQSLIQKSYH
jgi:hypothetical protein